MNLNQILFSHLENLHQVCSFNLLSGKHLLALCFFASLCWFCLATLMNFKNSGNSTVSNSRQTHSSYYFYKFMETKAELKEYGILDLFIIYSFFESVVYLFKIMVTACSSAT